jgi:uncharacterized protein YndB with AHSA1/START domain
MAANVMAKAEVTIQAPASKVWEALTSPEIIREYFFGAEASSDWKVGSPLEFRGTWEGNEYIDKGVILRSEPERLFQFTYLSSFSGLEDVPENYANISYELYEEEGVTTLTVRQENLPDEEYREQTEANWGIVLNNLKQILEKETSLA